MSASQGEKSRFAGAVGSKQGLVLSWPHNPVDAGQDLHPIGNPDVNILHVDDRLFEGTWGRGLVSCDLTSVCNGHAAHCRRKSGERPNQSLSA